MKINWQSLKRTSRIRILAFILMCICALWYVSQFVRFGFVYDRVDLMGLYFISSMIALIMVFKFGDKALQKRFIFIICSVSILVTILFFGQFLGTFGGVYSKQETIYFEFLRATMLLAAGTTAVSLKPSHHFVIPKLLLIIVGCAAVNWVLIYAFPQMVRESFGTRSAPSELFPDGILLLSMRNPERIVQRNALTILVISWLAIVVLGYVRYFKAVKASALPEDITTSIKQTDEGQES